MKLFTLNEVSAITKISMAELKAKPVSNAIIIPIGIFVNDSKIYTIGIKVLHIGENIYKATSQIIISDEIIRQHSIILLNLSVAVEQIIPYIDKEFSLINDIIFVDTYKDFSSLV